MASEVNYRKSKFSSGSDGNCIEAGNNAEHVFIRDTKQRQMSDDERTTLAVSPAGFRTFVKRIQASLSIADRIHGPVNRQAACAGAGGRTQATAQGDPLPSPNPLLHVPDSMRLRLSPEPPIARLRNRGRRDVPASAAPVTAQHWSRTRLARIEGTRAAAISSANSPDNRGLAYLAAVQSMRAPPSASEDPVTIAVTLGDAGTAVDVARGVNINVIEVTKRKTSLLIDTARAFLQRGRHEKARVALRPARETALDLNLDRCKTNSGKNVKKQEELPICQCRLQCDYRYAATYHHRLCASNSTRHR